MTLLPLYFFIFLGLFSPGPNVIMLTTSGARFGFWKTLPHLLGVAFGVGVTSGLTGLGLGGLLVLFPALTVALKILAAAWILVLAYRLYITSGTGDARVKDQPFTFVEAVLFQWVNPKIWAVALAAMAYIPDLDPVRAGWILGTGFSGINLFVCLFWVSAGSLLSYLLDNPRAMQLFLRGMAILLALSALAIFL